MEVGLRYVRRYVDQWIMNASFVQLTHTQNTHAAIKLAYKCCCCCCYYYFHFFVYYYYYFITIIKINGKGPKPLTCHNKSSSRSSSWREAFSHSIPPLRFVAKTICLLPAPVPVSRQIWWIQVVGGPPWARLQSGGGRTIKKCHNKKFSKIANNVTTQSKNV